MTPANPRPVHLIGSVPLRSTEEVFETVGARLGALAPRVPDGETGERLQFIGWQEKLFSTTPGLQPDGEWEVAGRRAILYGLAPNVNPENVVFGPLGYARAAKASFKIFSTARDAGKLPPRTRMQVSLPTPLTVMIRYAARASLLQLWPVYERQMLTELAEILTAIPLDDLAIQWDVAPEVHTVLEQPTSKLTQLITRDRLVAAVARITDSVPASADVGWHLCYGDPGHKHIVEPRDMSIMVDLANDVLPMTKRTVNWIHMPVPRQRDDASYFAALSKLQLPHETVLYLGLVHALDGLEGAKRRAAAAMAVHPLFGIATECGLGRRPPDTIPALLDLHREIAYII